MANRNTRRLRRQHGGGNPITESTRAQANISKHDIVVRTVVAPPLRGSALNTNKLRRDSGRRPWLADR